MTEMPPWVYRTFALIMFGFIGQLIVEYAKIKMRQSMEKTAEKEVVKSEWTGSERRQQTFTIDDIMLGQILASYNEHIGLVKSMSESIKIQNNLFTTFARNFDEHTQDEIKTRKMVRQLHEHFNLQES